MQTETLPLWQTPCPECLGDVRAADYRLMYSCTPCQGTGLRYWMLSTECPTERCDGGYYYSGVEYMGHYERWICSNCHGTGRIEKQGPEVVAALLEALFTVRPGIALEHLSPLVYTVMEKRGMHGLHVIGEGDTLEAALRSALEATEVARGN